MTETVEGKEKVRKPVVKKLVVRTIREKDGRSLIEFIDRRQMIRRVFVSTDVIVDERVPDTVLAEAIPYGIPWEEAFAEAAKKCTPETRANELRKAGIWTEDDLFAKQQIVFGALKAGFVVEQGQLHKLAASIKKGE